MKNSDIKQGLQLKKNKDIFEINNISAFIYQSMNHHVIARIKGSINTDTYDLYTREMQENDSYELIYVKNGTPTTLFVGLALDMYNKTDEGKPQAICSIELNLISYTYLMDIKEQTSSFQNIDMEYDALLNHINNKHGAVCITAALNHNGNAKHTINQFTLQWRETDWMFIKRMASRYHAPVVSNALQNKPRYIFGHSEAADRGTIENFQYHIKNNMADYRLTKQNKYIDQTLEVDHQYYEVVSYSDEPIIFSVGDSMTYQNKKLYVCRIETKIENHTLKNIYQLTSKNGFQQKKFLNANLTGVSLVGKVIDVKQNALKVHLITIDQKQEVDVACWFRYATFYSTWYCMPEIGDLVNLYFPTSNEVDAVIINSMNAMPADKFPHNNTSVNTPKQINQGTSAGSQKPAAPINFAPMASNPNVKMMSTADGKTVALTDSAIMIQCNEDTFITLTDGEGIQIVSYGSDIQIHSSNDIAVSCDQELTIKANEKINMTSSDSSVELRPAEVNLMGSDIKMN